MTLQSFLEENRNLILESAEEKIEELAGSKPSSQQLKKGMPLFFDQLVRVFSEKIKSNSSDEMLAAAASHGKEFLRLGYSLSHVVHAYGAMCQAITELATTKNAMISSGDFNILNGCLDVAIATAVSEFQFRSNEASEERELQHLGFLVHELRNALSSAAVAHEMIKAGLVGSGGSTAAVLEANFTRMRNLIDRSLSEVRMRADSELMVEKFRLLDLFDQIIFTAKVDATKRKQHLKSEIDWQIEIEADRQFILTALANLVQNAIKYTKTGGTICLRAKEVEDRVIIEVEDECGGLQEDKISSLFEPFVQGHLDRSGLGLGLAIVKRAIHLSQGTITAGNRPGRGCSFIINIPKKIVPGPSSKISVSGLASVRPSFVKKV